MGRRSVAVVPRFFPFGVVEGFVHGAAFDEADELLGDAGPGEETAGFVGAHAGEAVPDFGMAEMFQHHDAEVFFVEGVAEEGVPSEGDGAKESAVNRDNGGATAGHGFDGGHAEGFVAAAEDEEIGGAVVVGEVFVGDVAGEFDVVFEAEFFGEGFEFGEDAFLLRVHFFAADGEMENDLGERLATRAKAWMRRS
jgi:hypothetical protein